jgi:dynein heavy chain
MLLKSVKTKDNVEKWLAALEQEMMKVVKRNGKQALDDFDLRSEQETFKRTDWITDEHHNC